MPGICNDSGHQNCVPCLCKIAPTPGLGIGGAAWQLLLFLSILDAMGKEEADARQEVACWHEEHSFL